MGSKFLSVILSLAVVLGLSLVPAVPVANVALANPDYNLAVNITGNGSVTANGTPLTGYPNITPHTDNTEVTINATADACWHFVNWTGEVSTVVDVNATNTTINMTDNYSITANFAINTYNLTMDKVGNGTVTPGSGTYPEGNMTINAIPDAGWVFVNWSTADMAEIANASANSTTLTLDKDKTVTATFEEVVAPSNATLIGHMTFPGTVAGRVMTVRFYDPANKTEMGWSPLYGTTDASGNFTVDNVTPGTWDVLATNCSSLTEMSLGETFTAGNTTYVNFGDSREGDSDGDDWVTLYDRAQLYNGWGSAAGEPKYNVCCDFDRDGWLTLYDRAIMYGKWGQSGDKAGY